MTKLPPDVSELENLTELEQVRRKAYRLEHDLRKAKARTEDLVIAAREGAREAGLIMGNPPEVKPPKADKRTGKAEAALIHLSDWQVGKVTASFNSEVAKTRVEQLVNKLLRVTEVERADHPVRECHTMLGGDLPEGVSIFPGQQYEIDSGLFQQVFTCIGAVENFVRVQLANFEKVHVWAVYGNHGRIGKRGDHPREDNSDLFIAEVTRERLSEYEKSGRLVWHAWERWYTVVKIGNYRALLVHGDQVKQFGGNLPAFGIARKVNAWASGVVEPFEDCYMGHFHQPLVLPLAAGHRRTFVNPSIESDSAYAQEFVAAVGTPGQRLNFVDPAKGRVTSERILWLD